MKLVELYIDDFKNLKDFKIKFEEEGINFLVGQNGTGKSNLFEAIIEIFLYLLGEQVEIFNFMIKYKINEEDIKIEYDNKILKLNNRGRSQRIPKSKLPEMILTYYSGHNRRIDKYVQKYEKAYRGDTGSKLISETKESRKIFGVQNNHKQILLLMLSIIEQNKKFNILERIGVNKEHFSAKLILKKPIFFKEKEVESMGLGDIDYLWKIQGKLKDFLDELIIGNHGDTIDGQEGFISDDQFFYITLRADILEKFIQNESILKLFNCFDDLYLLDMIEKIEIKLEKESGSLIKLNDLSDGEIQTFIFNTLVEVFEEKRCLILLDEPDAFLHPEWQIKLFESFPSNSTKKNHILINTHNVSTLIPANLKVNLFQIRNEKTVASLVEKTYAVKQLSSGYIALNHEEGILNIIRSIQSNDKPILFTEGVSDPIIIEKAWEKLKGTEIPFKPLYAFSDEYLSRLLKDEKIHNELNGNPIFGLFDFDEAYNYWNTILSKGDYLERNPYKGLCAKLKNKKSYGFLLPVPNNEIIKRQVIKSETTNETFKYESRHSIELMFYDYLGECDHFQRESCVGGEKLVFKGNKVNFAKDVVPTLPKEAFVWFEPMFETIENILKEQ